MKTLILGGVRSGKSRLAEKIALAGGLPVTYVATATAGDHEMQQRIQAHRTRRPANWALIEEPLALTERLQECVRPGHCVIVDCLTLWLTNLMTDADDVHISGECDKLVTALAGLRGDILLVSNETNLGIIPANHLARRYCDFAGTLHQTLAQQCERVVFMVAGLPSVIKGAPL